MLNYFIRRLLIAIPTFIGITFIVFTITRFVPGGPVEMAILRYQAMQSQGETTYSSSNSDSKVKVSDEMVEKLKEIYGFDKPFYLAYIIWFKNLILLDMGESDSYSRPVWNVIVEKFPVSIRFGLIGFILAYTICIPLGVYKAIKNKSPFDVVSSAIIFILYSIPGWVIGIVLLVLLGGGRFLDIFPLGGIESLNHDDLPFIQKIWDSIHHMFLPVTCYMLGSFASLTILMKNSFIENISKDYARTAFAKGLPEKIIYFKHILRNSIIPIATGLGHVFSLVLAGSYLIEKAFNIHGMGLLGFNSIMHHDYPVILGIVVFGAVLKLLGNIISDFLYCIIDPRIRLD